jgi:hypothetical protein
MRFRINQQFHKHFVVLLMPGYGQNRPLRMLAKFFIPKFSEWQLFGKQPCVLFGSTRPKPAGRDNYPISIVKTYRDPIGYPVFGEQIDVITESLRP